MVQPNLTINSYHLNLRNYKKDHAETSYISSIHDRKSVYTLYSATEQRINPVPSSTISTPNPISSFSITLSYSHNSGAVHWNGVDFYYWHDFYYSHEREAASPEMKS